jgi:hypothetical protein
MSVTLYPGYSQQIVEMNLRLQTIASVTNANPMVITTVNNHGYVAGMNLTFLIPIIFGMQELNNLNAQVLSVTSNSLTINLNSINFSVFSYPSPLPSAFTLPSVIPNASGPYLPPQPLPYGNQDSFEGVIFNDGQPGNPI